MRWAMLVPDGKGLAGIEKTYDDQLTKEDKTLQLSMDIRVQHALKSALSDAIKKFSAVGASGLVMDVQTGELLGLISLPDYNLNHFEKTSSNARFNRALSGVYETGQHHENHYDGHGAGFRTGAPG